jgi:hypothetical protein
VRFELTIAPVLRTRGVPVADRGLDRLASPHGLQVLVAAKKRRYMVSISGGENATVFGGGNAPLFGADARA